MLKLPAVTQEWGKKKSFWTRSIPLDHWDHTLCITVHLAWTVKSEGFFSFIPGHEHVAHISAIVTVSHGLSGNLGADRTLFSSLISCLWRNPVCLVGPVARLWNNTVFHQAHRFFLAFFYISFIKSFGAFWRGVWVFSYPYTPTWQHHKHPLWEDSWGDRAENTENKSH